MRKLCLTMALLGLLALPVMGQFPGMFGRGTTTTGDMLLANKSVQKELKLTEKDTEKLAQIQKDSFAKVREAFQDGFEEGQKAMQEASKTYAKELKKFREGMTKDQKKRFGEIEYQVAAQTNDLGFFGREDVQKALKMTEKQKKLLKTTESDLEKDTKEVMDDAKENMNFRAIFTKIPELRKTAYGKFAKSFDDDQKKLIKELGGKEFKFEQGGFGKGGKGKFGKKKKTDDD